MTTRFDLGLARRLPQQAWSIYTSDSVAGRWRRAAACRVAVRARDTHTHTHIRPTLAPRPTRSHTPRAPIPPPAVQAQEVPARVQEDMPRRAHGCVCARRAALWVFSRCRCWANMVASAVAAVVRHQLGPPTVAAHAHPHTMPPAHAHPPYPSTHATTSPSSPAPQPFTQPFTAHPPPPHPHPAQARCASR
jgi:hypothetical protein